MQQPKQKKKLANDGRLYREHWMNSPILYKAVIQQLKLLYQT